MDEDRHPNRAKEGTNGADRFVSAQTSCSNRINVRMITGMRRASMKVTLDL